MTWVNSTLPRPKWRVGEIGILVQAAGYNFINVWKTVGLYNDQAIAELHSCSLGGLGCAPGPLEKSIPVGRQSTGQTRTLAVLSKTYDLCCGFDKTLWYVYRSFVLSRLWHTAKYGMIEQRLLTVQHYACKFHNSLE